jgi:fibronectin-binding autotransporter adhesin
VRARFSLVAPAAVCVVAVALLPIQASAACLYDAVSNTYTCNAANTSNTGVSGNGTGASVHVVIDGATITNGAGGGDGVSLSVTGAGSTATVDSTTAGGTIQPANGAGIYVTATTGASVAIGTQTGLGAGANSTTPFSATVAPTGGGFNADPFSGGHGQGIYVIVNDTGTSTINLGAQTVAGYSGNAFSGIISETTGGNNNISLGTAHVSGGSNGVAAQIFGSNNYTIGASAAGTAYPSAASITILGATGSTAVGNAGVGIGATIDSALTTGDVNVGTSASALGTNATGLVGISAKTAGSGNVNVYATGTITGTGTFGLATSATTGQTTINLGASAVVTGTTDAVNVAITGSGNGTVTNAGTIGNGASAARGFVGAGNTGTITLTNAAGATITSGSAAAIAADSGTLVVNNSGTLNSFATTAAGAVLTVNNSNSWTNAGNAAGTALVTTLNNTGGTTDIGGAGNTLNTTTLSMQGGTLQNGTLAATTTFDIQSGTVSAALAGAGTLTKSTAGTATLSGANTYSGGTIISAGTLQIAGAGTLGTATNALGQSGGTLDLGGTAQTTGTLTLSGGTLQNGTLTSSAFNTQAGTISAVLAGAGALTQSGPGTTILSGNNTYSGPTSVNTGTLTVDGTITSAATINSGATLNGTGTIGMFTVGNGGTIAVGNASTYGLLQTTGNATFQSGSTYALKVAPNNINDLLLIGGSAALAGGTVRVSATGSAGDYSSITKYLILNAANGIVSPFAGVTTNLGFFTPSLSYDANNVFLTLGNPQFTQGATTPTQSAVGNAIQAAFDAGERGPLVDALQGLTAGQAAGALTQLSGQGTTGTQQTSFEAGRLFMSTMSNQAGSWARGDVNGPNSMVMYEKPLGYAASKPSSSNAFAALKAPPSDTEKVRTWRVWGSAFGGELTIGDNTGAGLGYSAQTSGGAIGADYQVNPNLLGGFAVGGSTSNFQVPGSLTSGQLDGGHLGLYGVAKFGDVYFRSGLSYAHFINSTSRTVSDTGVTQTELGHFGSDQLAGDFELGWRRDFGRIALTPFVSFGYYDTIQQAYSETGAATNVGPDLYGLKFGERTGISMPGSLGLQIDGKLNLNNGWVWSPFARAALTHEFSPLRQIDASLQQLPDDYFTVGGIMAEANFATLRFGSRVWFNDTVSAFASVDGIFGDRTRGYAAIAGINFLTDLQTRTTPVAAAAPYTKSPAEPAPVWTTSATPDIRFDTFSSTRGFPAAGTLSPGSGSQLYSSVTLSASGTPVENLKVDLSAKPGYVYTRQSTTGLSGSVSTITDTTFSGTFTYTGINGIQPFYSLNLNLPSGRSMLLGSAGNARLDPDFVEVGTFGEGFNIGPTLGVNLPFNDKLTMSISGGYTHHGPYDKDGLIDPFTFVQAIQQYSPGHDLSASVNLSYQDAPFSTQLSTSYQHETITYLDGTPSYQLGDRYTVSLTEAYTWSALTQTSFTATVSYIAKNHTLDTSIPAFPVELADSNSINVRLRLDQPFTINAWTVNPFASFVYRDQNSYDPANDLFAPAKTMESIGGSLRYAFSSTSSLQGSVEHFWAHELPAPAILVPAIDSTGWKLALTGRIAF